MSAAKLFTPTNLLLASLPEKEYENILSLGKLVELSSGDILGQAGKNFHSIYFPVNCTISLISQLNGKTKMEIAIVGPEGMLGLNSLLDVKVSLLNSIVEVSGTALTIDNKVFHKVHSKSTALQKILKNYIFVRLYQFSQTATCNRFHVINARLARWILMAQDCAHFNEFYVTHECLANKLGVRRAGVTQAAGELQKKKLISYKKGHLRILDRKGLETITCGCYQLNKNIYKDIMKAQ